MTNSAFRLARVAGIAIALFVSFTLDVTPAAWRSGTVVSQAEAVVGRPATPGSVAGVARRTTRRAVRRHY
jgi:hypothetical protein